MSQIAIDETLTGVDIIIDRVKTVFENNLWLSISNVEINGRAFQNKRKDKIIPEVLSGSEYVEVKFDDTKNAKVFFYANDEVNFEMGKFITRRMDIIFQVNLSQIYPSLSYRATEEVYRDVLDLLKKHFLHIIEPKQIISGLNAYGIFSTDNLKAYDMQPWHVFNIKTVTIINY